MKLIIFKAARCEYYSDYTQTLVIVVKIIRVSDIGDL